jgi:hypothetical protein
MWSDGALGPNGYWNIAPCTGANPNVNTIARITGALGFGDYNAGGPAQGIIIGCFSPPTNEVVTGPFMYTGVFPPGGGNPVGWTLYYGGSYGVSAGSVITITE